jgi:tRNA A-37 threonylcarbamoyl transferase component Bud32
VTLLPLPQILPYRDRGDPSIRGRAVAGYGHLSLSSLPWNLREGETENGIPCVKASETRRVLTFEETVGGREPMRLFAKRNRSRTLPKAIGYRLYRSKARREWDIGWALVRRGFLTGRPVIVAERRQRGLVRESHLVTEAIGAERSLADQLRLIVEERGEDPAPLVAPLAAFVRDLHATGFHHDDLSANHVWVHQEGQALVFGIIDLDQSRFRWRTTLRQRRMNLFQVLRSIPESLLPQEHRLAFLEGFHGDGWDRERDEVMRWLRAMSAKRGEPDVLG